MRFKQDGGWERGGEGQDLRAMWSVKRTLELVQLDGKGRGTGGGLQGLWLIGTAVEKWLGLGLLGVAQAGGWVWGLEQRSGLERHMGEVGL